MFSDVLDTGHEFIEIDEEIFTKNSPGAPYELCNRGYRCHFGSQRALG